MEREGLLNPEIKDRLTQPKSSSLWTSLAQKMLFLGLALAKDKLYEQFFAGEEKPVDKKDNIWGFTNLECFNVIGNDF